MNRKEYDDKIVAMQKKLNEKQEAVGRQKKLITSSHKTNLIVKLNGATHNLNVLSQEELSILYLQLSAMSDTYYNIKDSAPHGLIFPSIVSDWMYDIELKLLKKDIAIKEAGIKSSQKKLAGMLSQDKQFELSFDDTMEEAGKLISE